MSKSHRRSKKPAIEVLVGLPGSGKTARLFEIYRDVLRKSISEVRPGAALWLSPTLRASQAIRERLLDASLPAVFDPRVLTFARFADEVLAASPQPATPLSPAMQRTLLRRIVLKQLGEKRLSHFGGIARTSGFLDLVTGLISELKRSESWPDVFEAACHQGTLLARDRELAEIYREYQKLLEQREVYDNEGRFWSAQQALEQGHWGPFAALDLVVLDGFTDFTFTQFSILLRLAERSGRMLLTLPLDPGGARSDLFAKTSDVLERLQSVADVRVTQLSAAPPEPQALPPAIAQIARLLFSNPRDVTPTANAAGLEIVAAAGEIGEVQMLAARVKQLLVNGVPPSDIVIGVRSMDDYAALFEEIFTAARIPFRADASAPLSREPVLKALLAVLQLELDDWPFRRLMAVLDSSYFQPDWPQCEKGSATRCVAQALRRLKLEGGRQTMLAALDRAAGSTSPADRADLRDAARRAADLLERLSRTLSRLRSTHTYRAWSETVETLARELGLLNAQPARNKQPGGDKQPRLDDGDVWKTFQSILFATVRTVEYWEDAALEKFSLAEFVHELTDLLQTQSVSHGASEAGRVRILDAAQVRNLDVPWLFLAGLTERSFPRHRGEDCLYNEAERHELNARGLSLGHRAVRTQEEMLLFYGVVTRARRKLVLSYPAVGPAGQPLSPSPFLLAIRELFERSALPQVQEDDLDPVPAAGRVLSLADARLRGMRDALEQQPGLYSALLAQPESGKAAANVLAAIDMAVQRFHTPGFTPYEGRLKNARNLSLLAARYASPFEFSATQLEAYAACPFQFFLSNVLRIQALEQPETSTDFALRGVLVHDVLAELHRQLLAERRGDPSLSVPDGLRVTELFHKLLEARLGDQPNASLVQQALLRVERMLLEEWGGVYGTQWDQYHAAIGAPPEDTFVPTHFETSFGTPYRSPRSTPGAAPDEDGAGDVADEPVIPGLVFGTGPDETRVAGRIDRVDVGRIDGQPVFTVVDYKTGKQQAHRPEEVGTGHALQLALYTLAVQRLGIVAGARPYQMGYWNIKQQGFLPGLRGGSGPKKNGLSPLDEAVWQSLEESLEIIIPRLAAGIRNGSFPVINQDENCTGRCPYNTVCRVAQIRALPEEMLKTWSP